jgi:nicotinamidase-related amidase
MMPEKNPDLHGNAPDNAAAALVLIDMINDLEFEGGALLLEPALAAARRIAELKQRARAVGIPAVYVNDNFGRWRSDFREAVEHCLHGGVRGRPLAEVLLPQEDDYFVLKPKHSAFYATTLETLLEYLGASRLIITGVATDVCVTFTVLDAFMRDFELYVPSDCVASVSPEESDGALHYLRRVCGVDTRPSADLDLAAVGRPSGGARGA